MNYLHMAKREPATEWGRFVQSALDAHKLNPGSQFYRTEISRSTVRGWTDHGSKPTRENALAFIRGIGADENEGLRAAGIITGPRPLDRLRQEYGDIAVECAKRGKEAPDLTRFIPLFQGGNFESATDEEVDRILDKIRKAAGLPE